MTPKRTTYWRLDSVAGWRSAKTLGISFTPGSGDVELDALPGTATPIDDTLASAVGYPVAIAGDHAGRVLSIDAQRSQIVVLDLAAKTARAIEALGGPGPRLRQFHQARGVTVLPSGAIAIADTGNRRVQLFSASPYALLQVWEDFAQPWAVSSDAVGVIYVLDRAGRRISKFCASGEPLGVAGESILKNPSDIAAQSDGTLAVVDGDEVIVFPTNAAEPLRIRKVNLPLSVAFDPSGNLFVGTANALVAKLEADRNVLDGYRVAGEGVTDIDGLVNKVAWVKGLGIVVLLQDSDLQTAPRLATISPAGAFRREGLFATETLNSYIEKCPWHRVQISGIVPAGTSLQIESATSSQSNKGFDQYSVCALFGGDKNAASGDTIDPDCLIQSDPGQYLRLRFKLRSNGKSSPVLRAVKVFFPRESYLRYLPAVFQEDAESRSFLDLFLSIFETSFDDFDQLIDNLWTLFDPFAVPDKYFPWLAAWMALPLDRDMNLPKRREVLKTAFQDYLMRGTVRGLEKSIRDYAGVYSPRILEHFRLRHFSRLELDAWLHRGTALWSRKFYQRLQLGVYSQVGSFRLTNQPEPTMEPFDFGSNRFSVVFPANPYTVAKTAEVVRRVVEREKPAWTEALLCPVFARMRVGVQATLGVDAMVGRAGAMALGQVSTLSFDAFLSASGAERDARALGASLEPRLGENTRIL